MITRERVTAMVTAFWSPTSRLFSYSVGDCAGGYVGRAEGSLMSIFYDGLRFLALAGAKKAGFPIPCSTTDRPTTIAMKEIG